MSSSFFAEKCNTYVLNSCRIEVSIYVLRMYFLLIMTANVRTSAIAKGTTFKLLDLKLAVHFLAPT